MSSFVRGMLLAVVACVAARAPGATLFSFQASLGGSQPGVMTSINYFIGYGSHWPELLYAEHDFTLDDMGRTETIPPSDPYFSTFAGQLTNGMPDEITFWFSPAPAVNMSGVGLPEAYVAWGDASDPRVDLQGYTLTSFSIRQDALTIAHDGSGRSSFSATITFTAEGVPEPRAVGLMSMATLGFTAGARRRRRRVATRLQPTTARR